MAGIVTGQRFAVAAALKRKTVGRRICQLYRNDFDGGPAVGAERQNVFGIGSEHNLAHRHRIGRGGQRNLALHGRKLNVLR